MPGAFTLSPIQKASSNIRLLSKMLINLYRIGSNRFNTEPGQNGKHSKNNIDDAEHSIQRHRTEQNTDL